MRLPFSNLLLVWVVPWPQGVRGEPHVQHAYGPQGVRGEPRVQHAYGPQGVRGEPRVQHAYGLRRRLDDTPEYSAHLKQLVTFAANQSSYFIKSFHIHDWWNVCNVPIVKYVYRLGGQVVRDEDTLFFSLWKDDYIIYNITIGGNREDHFNIVRRGSLVLYSNSTPDSARIPYHLSQLLHAGDGRLYVVNGTLRYLFCVYKKKQLQSQALMEIHYNDSSGELYSFPPVHLRVGTKNQTKQEKNWSPFDYRGSNYFVHWVWPHTVIGIGANTTSNIYNTAYGPSLSLETLYHGESRNEPLWDWGYPHGGTNSLLIDTGIYGMKYLHIFHSQQQRRYGIHATYYMGAYLFNTEPPFGITHITAQPLVPPPFYNESLGWAFRVIDYIVFPLSVVESRGRLYISTGYNDKSMWIVIFDKVKFIESLVEM